MSFSELFFLQKTELVRKVTNTDQQNDCTWASLIRKTVAMFLTPVFWYRLARSIFMSAIVYPFLRVIYR